jgi:hypothetical protein
VLAETWLVLEEGKVSVRTLSLPALSAARQRIFEALLPELSHFYLNA